MVCSSPLHYVRSNNSFSLESRGPFLAGGHDYLPVLRCPTDTCSIRNNIGILSTCGSSSFLQQNDGQRIERFWACGQTPFWLLPWNKGLFGSIYHFRIDTPAGHEAKAKYDLRQSYRILILGPVLHLLSEKLAPFWKIKLDKNDLIVKKDDLVLNGVLQSNPLPEMVSGPIDDQCIKLDVPVERPHYSRVIHWKIGTKIEGKGKEPSL